MPAHPKKGANAPRPSLSSPSLEEAAVQRLAEHIEEGNIKSYKDIFDYIETAKKAQEANCPVCLKSWSSPARAKCGHIFCEACLISWETSCRKRHIPFNCPCCRCEIQIVERTPPPPPAQSKKKIKQAPTKKNQPQNRCACEKRYKHFVAGDGRWSVLIAAISCLMLFSLFLLWYDQQPSINASTAAWQRWADRQHNRQHVLPRLAELVEQYGAATYVFAKVSITIFPKESVDQVPAGQSLDHYDLPAQAYYPVGTIFRIVGDVPNSHFTGGMWYHNSTVLDVYGNDVNQNASIPMRLVNPLLHERVNLISLSDARQKILPIENGTLYSKRDLELNHAMR